VQQARKDLKDYKDQLAPQVQMEQLGLSVPQEQ